MTTVAPAETAPANAAAGNLTVNDWQVSPMTNDGLDAFVVIVPAMRPEPPVRLPAEQTTSPVSFANEKLPAIVVSNVAGAAEFDGETLIAVSVKLYVSAV